MTVTLTATYQDGAGTPCSGRVVFRLAEVNTDGTVIYTDHPVSEILDANGALSVALTPTDTMSTTSSYEVTERLNGTPVRQYFVQLDSTPTSQDLASLRAYTAAPTPTGRPSNHGDLNGLTTDDHPQYLLSTPWRRGLYAPPPSMARLGSTPSTMTSPPTVTIAAGSPTIASAVRVSSNDARLSHRGLAVTNNATGYGGYANCADAAGITSSTSTAGRSRVEFETDAANVEIALWAQTSSSMYRILVDGQYVNATPQSLGTGSQTWFVKLAFGSRANRRIIAEGHWAMLNGIWVAPTDTVWATTAPAGPRCLWVGDSFSEGSGGSSFWWQSWANLTRYLLGWDVWPSAVGSTGYIADGGGGGKVKYRDRLTADVTTYDPDIVVIAGGYNDTGSTEAAITTEATLLFQAVRSAMPDATLVVAGPNTSAGVTGSGVFTTVRDGVKAAFDAVGGDYWVDPVAYPTNTSWITGTGKVGSTNGSGNADYYTHTDGIHPSDAGHLYLARRFASAVAALAV